MQKNIGIFVFKNLFSVGVCRIFGVLQKVRLVGGCVRDSVLGLDAVDIDFATSLLPEQVIDVCSAAGIKTFNANGIRFGTVVAVIDGVNYEITTLRRDVRCYGRHADVEYTSEWLEDASRRDFTFNALYLDENGVLYDYFGGMNDLRNGELRFIGDPVLRVKEDYLRILRAFRFYGRFCDKPLSATIIDACAEYSSCLDKLAGERIWKETLQLFEIKRLVPALKSMREAIVLPRVFPGIDENEVDNAFAALGRLDNCILRIALFTRLTRCDVDVLGKRWCIDRETLKLLKTLHDVNLSQDLVVLGQKYMNIYGESIYKMALLMAKALGNIDDDDVNINATEFPISNADIMACNMVGKKISETRKILYTAWLDSNCTLSRESLLAMIVI